MAANNPADFARAQLHARGLTIERGERRVIKNFGLDLASGAALVVRGANGSGKTTLLRALAGLIAPTGGEIVWNGTAIAREREAHRARLHYVGHLDAVKGALTVRDNLAFWARLGGGRAASERAAAALAAFGLEALAELPARLLSAGQRRRVGLARLALAPAPLWLLDEPTTGLDAAASAALARLVADQRARGGLVVIATHGDDGPGDAATLTLAAAARDAA